MEIPIHFKFVDGSQQTIDVEINSLKRGVDCYWAIEDANEMIYEFNKLFIQMPNVTYIEISKSIGIINHCFGREEGLIFLPEYVFCSFEQERGHDIIITCIEYDRKYEEYRDELKKKNRANTDDLPF